MSAEVWVEAERHLLGALIIGAPIDEILERVSAESFSSTDNSMIWEAMVALWRDKRPIDLLTVTAELERQNRLEQAGGSAYVSSLMDHVPDVENATHYADMIAEAARRRKTRSIADELSRRAAADPDMSNALAKAHREIVELASDQRRGFQQADVVVERNTEKLREIFESGKSITGLPTGLTQLDRILGGLQPKDLVIVAARPGMGKTAFAVNIATNLTVKHDFRVGFFSLEMSAEQLTFRVLCSMAHVPMDRIRSGLMSRDEKLALLMASKLVKERPLYIDDTAQITLMEVRARATLMKERFGLDAVFVDYLQIMGTRGGNENRVQEVGRLSAGLKALAKDLAVPVVALSQLSRRTEQRGDDREPVLSDLRESGAIEQDADVVIFLTREAYYDQSNQLKNVADVVIAKHRNGAVGRFKAGWLGAHTRFADLRTRENA